MKLSVNFSNLLEVPILFYTLGVLLVALNISSPVILVLSWCFEGLRIVLSIIPITYNLPKHRFYVFLPSCLPLSSFWLLTFTHHQALSMYQLLDLLLL
ncbi:MAPEG family protein [Vibrio parahaemolyticus]|uniref:MAPEG family protein n=1 Tax=Vibrio parahaemolyticus TaxID=670 RepID=UPI00344D2E0F